MQSLQKHPNPQARRKTSQEWIEHFRTERQRWQGQEHTKAYRMRNAGNRFRVRGW
jgi:hypothetical protein